MSAPTMPLPDSAEQRARRAIEERLGRTLHDAEWASYRARLLAFVTLLQEWESGSRSTGDVE